MTQLKTIEHGIEKENKGECGLCFYFIRTNTLPALGKCINENSDHFGHILDQYHPACEECIK